MSWHVFATATVVLIAALWQQKLSDRELVRAIGSPGRERERSRERLLLWLAVLSTVAAVISTSTDVIGLFWPDGVNMIIVIETASR